MSQCNYLLNLSELSDSWKYLGANLFLNETFKAIYFEWLTAMVVCSAGS